MGEHANIYLFDLRDRRLTPEDIKRLTENEDGIDITSVRSLEPHLVFYDWFAHEAFNEDPDEIYVPYGSGRIFENLLAHQERSVRNDTNGRKDPRLKIPLSRLVNMNILGAEPEKEDSVADKLTARFKPFRMFDDHDIGAVRSLLFTGENTGVYRVSEERINQAHRLMSREFETGPSASAGLALYLDRFEKGEVNPNKKVLVVNTGKEI